MTSEISLVTSSSSRDSMRPEAWAKRKSPLRTATSGPKIRCIVCRWRLVSASSRMSSCTKEAVWMTSTAVASTKTFSLGAPPELLASSEEEARHQRDTSSAVSPGERIWCTRRHSAGRSRLPPPLKASCTAPLSFRLCATSLRPSSRRCTSAMPGATQLSSDSRSTLSGTDTRRSRPRSSSHSISLASNSRPSPTGRRGCGFAPPSKPPKGNWPLAALPGSLLPLATSRTKRSLSLDLRSLLRRRWSSARKRRLSTLISKRLPPIGHEALSSTSSAWFRPSTSGRQAMPSTSVRKASFSSLSSRHSRRAEARKPSRFTSCMVRNMPPSFTRWAASSKSAAPEGPNQRVASSSASRGSCSRAKITGAEIRPDFRALLMPRVRTSFRSPTMRPRSEPNSRICWAISSSTPFMKAAQAVDAPKNAATPAVCSISRYWRTVKSTFQSSSRFRSCPSLYAAMVLAMSLRHARECSLAMAHCAVA
mmetsp:Transcript_60543/g.109098  ORF Transcript_60543/g.109098 Transcript_60543/m.109098 type:complete len:479 (+) Transcript_60543:766-2202(+)